MKFKHFMVLFFAFLMLTALATRSHAAEKVEYRWVMFIMLFSGDNEQVSVAPALTMFNGPTAEADCRMAMKLVGPAIKQAKTTYFMACGALNPEKFKGDAVPQQDSDDGQAIPRSNT